MKEVISRIATDIMMTFYQAFWFSFLFAIIMMFLYMYANEYGEGIEGFKKVLVKWWASFKKEFRFRCMFFLAFYITMVLFRTLINRNLWLNPLSVINGGWSIYNENGTINIEPIENFMMLMPYSVLFLMSFKEKLFKDGNMDLKHILFQGFKVSFCFSLGIETAQLVLRLGTFQFADLFYNTTGGMLSSILYWIVIKIKGTRQ